MKRLFGIALACTICTGINIAHAGVVADSSSLSLRADADAGAGLVTNTDSQSQGMTVNTLTASAAANAAFGDATVTSTIQGLATWTGPDAGRVELSNIGWTTANVSNGTALTYGGLDYSYRFTSDTNAVFTLTYSLAGAGSNLFGLSGFDYDFNGHGLWFDLIASPTGTITENVAANTMYTVTLSNFGNITGGLGTRDAHMSGIFDFTIAPGSAVPEPSTFALIGMGGVGLLISAYRRRPTSV